MHYCKICNYFTNTNHSLNIHNNTLKHINNMYLSMNNDTNKDKKKNIIKKNNKDHAVKEQFACKKCNTVYFHRSSLSRHTKTCFIENQAGNYKDKDENILQMKIELMKKDNEMMAMKMELDRIKNEKEMERIKNEMDNLKEKINTKDIINNNTNISNTSINNNTTSINNNTTINNNIHISKINYLNVNFGNVIDINTFIENYKNNYSLSPEQSQTLLENFESDGVNGCINSLIYYLKKSAIKQYKELKGFDIDMNNIILPFLLSDKCVRDHFEKATDGKWDKTTTIENIKKIVNITNDLVYKHHNKYLGMNGSQKKRIINGILKESAFSILSRITIPEFYKNVILEKNILSESPVDIEKDSEIKISECE